MPTCKICLQDYRSLRFNTERMRICGPCVDGLNAYREVAEPSYAQLRLRLQKSLVARAQRQLQASQETWERDKARHTLMHLPQEVERRFAAWLNTLVAQPACATKPFQIIRAHRRGLLHFDRPQKWGYPTEWPAIAAKIRQLDGFQCVACARQEMALHVHHIVYTSHFGTHRKSNLVTLCRRCHEREHQRCFEFAAPGLNAPR